jgi:hypothetical protein
LAEAMIRFIDLTLGYWGVEAHEHHDEHQFPVCGFVNTVNDRFVETDIGTHTFDSDADVCSIEDPVLRARCLQLVPRGFWNGA